ncbi:SAM-dependent methyltransferase [Sphingobium sp. SCG-1]|uniref:class I SAM-dependent methyltransferase n=1 Tax=Sphingobium sp. SCG-1 TaxID=2072936 RepID=UPI000CD6B14A|nr:class I SAM-dependent methyltransferase [Sphingobium sp. SCG-1]AUW58856.1 SAM-dependent methyltransferase [Sphingobium sp. SCG-1]
MAEHKVRFSILVVSVSQQSPSHEIFDRRTRAIRRDRAADKFGAHDFLYRHMAEELLDRLADVKRDLVDVLVVGCPDDYLPSRLRALGKRVVCTDSGHVNAAAVGGVQADEDALPFADNSFDLIVACGTLESVNDLPGALLLMQRILRPDGLLLGAFAGAGSLPVLRAVLLGAEGDRAGQHIHPQVDVRAGGDLLSRAGFTMPVADGDTLTVRYGSIFGLLDDLRGMGASNVLLSRPPMLSRAVLSHAATLFLKAADADGKTAERFAIAYLSGWKPDPSQAAPARRGSATVSLAEALKPKRRD